MTQAGWFRHLYFLSLIIVLSSDYFRALSFDGSYDRVAQTSVSLLSKLSSSAGTLPLMAGRNGKH